jgi:peptidoglycan/LPS O-acetylase OafA/YrhL
LGACTYGAYLGHVFWIQVVTRFIDPAAYADGPAYPLAAVGVILSVSACSMATEALRQAMGRFLTSLRRAKAESGTARVT